MKLAKIRFNSFKRFDSLELDLEGKSTVIFGVNGMGKSTILDVINYLFRPYVYRINQAQKQAYNSFSKELIKSGKYSFNLHADVTEGDESFAFDRSYAKSNNGKKAMSVSYKEPYIKLANKVLYKFTDKENIPVFVNYGTTRSVLDIPLRIKTKHEFTQLASYEYAIEYGSSFRLFFEWYRYQEDIENQVIRETGNLNYVDPALRCVRTAIEIMLDNVRDLRVKRNPLCMVVKKNDTEVRVDQLSDGEKCTLALLGDLARRIAIANPYRENPMEGEGIVLIDEIELHMHPSWQRRILGVLKQLFPNVQFIITTHSPQVLGSVDNSYKIISLGDENAESTFDVIDRMDGFNTDLILEDYMGTASVNPLFSELVEKTKAAIREKRYSNAEELIKEVSSIVGINNENVIMLEGYLNRSLKINEANNKG